MIGIAKCEVKMPEDFLEKCSRLAEQTDVIIPKVLEDGGEVVLVRVKSNLQSAIGKNTRYPSQSTGTLLASLGLSPARVDRKGDHNVKVGFSEPRRGGGSNAKIANILEYGKSNQRPRPFLKPARASSRNACIEAMRARLEREIDGL